PFTVDNQLLLTAVETGTVGVALLVWMLAILWRTFQRAARAAPHTFTGVLATGILGALVGILVQFWAATPLGAIRTAEALWFLFGVGMAAIRCYEEQAYRAARGLPLAA
ncbi:MAG: hypothetical protein QHJ73_04345, partial [Armatimonadota bacterium]|nr:hypothetical protein [Armatimonadota bacterium]